MRAVWAAIVSVWAVLAIVTVLAWSRPQTPVAAQQLQPKVVLVKGKNGKQQLVAVTSTAASTHATTQTSPPPP